MSEEGLTQPAERRKAMTRDFALNLAASLLLTAATQVLVYPTISRMLSAADYGALLTTMGVVNVVGVSLGSSLNNARILLQREYDRAGHSGDYNLMFALLAVFAAAAITGTLYATGLSSGLGLWGFSGVAVLVLWRAYYSAAYRIRINYAKLLVSNGLCATGYVLGLALTGRTGYWFLAFLLGEAFACVYIAATSHLVREGFRRTPLFVVSARKFFFLLSGTVLAAVMVYMDRFLVYPLLGASEVSVYAVSSFLGKSTGLLLGPLAGVLLTYYAKAEYLSRENLAKQLVGIFGVSAAGFGLIVLAGRQVTGVLYPTLADQAMPYLAVANLGAMLFAAGNIIQPTILRFCNERWQPVIQGGYLTAYLGIGAVSVKVGGLLAFCWAVLGVNTVRLVGMAAVAWWGSVRSESKPDAVTSPDGVDVGITRAE